MEEQPIALVVFGATSDLANIKLYPTLYSLAKKGELPDMFFLYGVAREEMTKEAWRELAWSAIEKSHENVDQHIFDKLFSDIQWIDTDVTKSEGYERLEENIRKHESRLGVGVLRLFYLALPPNLFSDVARNVETCRMGKALCKKDNVLSRIIIEKPFGYDLTSAKELDRQLHKAFKEKQIYRIDHYLGKEAMNNILVFRFGNRLFEQHWNNRYVKQIQVNALETVSAAGRSAYYEDAGALRDMVQSHLFQFLAYLTMDKPEEMQADELHACKDKILQHIRPWQDGEVLVRGQYDGYREHDGVDPGSETETYVALKLEIDTDRWRGVPIYIRTGKTLSHKETSAIIEFSQEDTTFFRNTEFPLVNNLARIDVAPNTGVSFRVNMHAPGTHMGAVQAPMHYCQKPEEANVALDDYEHLLMAAMKGKKLLFAGSNEVLSAWRALDPFQQKETNLKIYQQGSDGPDTDILFSEDGWLDPVVKCKMRT